MTRSSLFRLLLTASLALVLVACSGEDKKEKDEMLAPDEPVDTLYNRGSNLMDSGQYKDAAKQFSEVDRQHPYSPWASKAELMEAYADYQNMDYDEAIKVLDNYIDLHPGSADAAYAFYLRALCHYERIADVRRAQDHAREALKGMQEVISRYPDSAYAKDAVLKTALINDHLAGAEMNVGRWYLNQKLYIAAIGRFRTVVEKYQTTSHVPEALERLVECYVALGINNEAQATAAVLGYNFPGSDWYQDAYNLLQKKNLAPESEAGSWIGHAWHTVF